MLIQKKKKKKKKKKTSLDEHVRDVCQTRDVQQDLLVAGQFRVRGWMGSEHFG
jgi:hypothetical protein